MRFSLLSRLRVVQRVLLKRVRSYYVFVVHINTDLRYSYLNNISVARLLCTNESFITMLI